MPQGFSQIEFKAVPAWYVACSLHFHNVETQKYTKGEKMKTTEIKSDIKSKANGAQKAAKSTFETALDSAPEVLATVTEYGKTFLNSMSGSKEKAMEAMTSLNKTLKEKPWAFVGGAAVFGFAAGFLLGRNRSPESSIRAGVISGVDRIKSEIEKNINKVSEHLQ